jgi:23S rRNA U2552 (ribose-2'-O)-methylase RlmE/FtsJ
MITKKAIGENALNRSVRLLRELNEKLIKSGNQEIELRLSGDGSGQLALLEGGEVLVSGYTLFEFDSTDQLVKFLEADALTQMRALKAQ